jgi:hypothetical protein
MLDGTKKRIDGGGERKRGHRAKACDPSVALLREQTDEDAVTWAFHRGADSRWRWRKTSRARGVIANSAHSHASYADCVGDAKSHGYREWLAPAKLKPLSFSHVPGLLHALAEKRKPASHKNAGAAKQDRSGATIESDRTAAESTNVVVLRRHEAT